jgi:hypothetical protein
LIFVLSASVRCSVVRSVTQWRNERGTRISRTARSSTLVDDDPIEWPVVTGCDRRRARISGDRTLRAGLWSRNGNRELVIRLWGNQVALVESGTLDVATAGTDRCALKNRVRALSTWRYPGMRKRFFVLQNDSNHVNGKGNRIELSKMVASSPLQKGAIGLRPSRCRTLETTTVAHPTHVCQLVTVRCHKGADSSVRKQSRPATITPNSQLFL